MALNQERRVSALETAEGPAGLLGRRVIQDVGQTEQEARAA